MHDYIVKFIHALIVTVSIETIVLAMYIFLCQRITFSRDMIIRICYAGIIASGCTLPFVWFGFPVIVHDRTYFLIIAETFAFVAEIPIIRVILKTKGVDAIVASFLANGISFTSGILMGMS